MYAGLGIHWASSVPAFLALACVPFPFIFYRYGPAIRKRCKFAAEAEQFMARLRNEAARGNEPASPLGSDSTAAGSVDAQQPANKDKEMEQDREAQLEAEAMDNSYGPEERQPQYAAIKTTMSRQSGPGASRSLHHARSATYEASPYDIDRVNTNESFGGRKAHSRTSSFRSLGKKN